MNLIWPSSLTDAGGAGPEAVAVRAGHRDSTITLQVYTHAEPERVDAAADVLGDALFGTGN